MKLFAFKNMKTWQKALVVLILLYLIFGSCFEVFAYDYGTFTKQNLQNIFNQFNIDGYINNTTITMTDLEFEKLHRPTNPKKYIIAQFINHTSKEVDVAMYTMQDTINDMNLFDIEMIGLDGVNYNIIKDTSYIKVDIPYNDTSVSNKLRLVGYNQTNNTTYSLIYTNKITDRVLDYTPYTGTLDITFNNEYYEMYIYLSDYNGLFNFVSQTNNQNTDTIIMSGITEGQVKQTGGELKLDLTLNGYTDTLLTYRLNNNVASSSFAHNGFTAGAGMNFYDNYTTSVVLDWDNVLVGANTFEIIKSADNTVVHTLNFTVEEKAYSFWDNFALLKYISPWHKDFFLKIAVIPQEGFFDNYFNDIRTAFDEKLPIVTQIYDLLHSLITVSYDETLTPEIMMTMPESYGGGTYNLINLEPFRPYRNDWITIIRIPMWYMFIRRTYFTIVGMV